MGHVSNVPGTLDTCPTAIVRPLFLPQSLSTGSQKPRSENAGRPSANPRRFAPAGGPPRRKIEHVSKRLRPAAGPLSAPTGASDPAFDPAFDAVTTYRSCGLARTWCIGCEVFSACAVGGCAAGRRRAHRQGRPGCAGGMAAGQTRSDLGRGTRIACQLPTGVLRCCLGLQYYG